MRQLLIFLSLTASLTLHGCSTVNASLDVLDDVADIIPSIFGSSSLAYQPTILQGNIITQEQVNKLKPGMSRRQVRFILGTPTLQDTFHADRWDYHYTQGLGSEPDEIKRLVVYFNADKLARISGDMQIQAESARAPTQRVTVVKVPDWTGEKDNNASFWPDFSKAFDWLDVF